MNETYEENITMNEVEEVNETSLDVTNNGESEGNMSVVKAIGICVGIGTLVGAATSVASEAVVWGIEKASDGIHWIGNKIKDRRNKKKEAEEEILDEADIEIIESDAKVVNDK